MEIQLKNVLCAPNMRRNLISGACMDIAGFRINWKDNKMIIYTKDNKYYFTVHRKNKLYVLYGLPDKRREEAYNTGKYPKNKLNMDTMHRRLCHVNKNIN